MTKETGDHLKSTIANGIIRAVENVGVEVASNIGLGGGIRYCRCNGYEK